MPRGRRLGGAVLIALAALSLCTAPRLAAAQSSDHKLVAVLTPAATRQAAQLALKRRLPAMLFTRRDVEAGGLSAYYVDDDTAFRRAAHYVDQILKGAAPRDLPVEPPSRCELAVNLKTVRALNVTLPPALLLRRPRDQVSVMDAAGSLKRGDPRMRDPLPTDLQDHRAGAERALVQHAEVEARRLDAARAALRPAA